MGEAKRKKQRAKVEAEKKGPFAEYLDRRLDPKALRDERKKQLLRIAKARGRPTLVFAADLRKGHAPISIAYEDIVPFHDVMDGLDGDSVDVILETPGGSGEVAEELVRLLRGKFNQVGFIIPGWAKSAGTIMTMAGDEILMGPASALGPIDAQISWRDKVFSAEAFLEGLEGMKAEANKHGLNRAHIPILQQISPGEIQHAQNALDFARVLVAKWLETYKFRNWKVRETSGKPVSDQERKKTAEKIARELCKHSRWLSHGRSIKKDDLIDLGLKITDYSEDSELSDAIRRYHTLLHITFESNVYKMFESEYEMVVRFVNVAPAGPAGSPKAQIDRDKTIDADIECPLCSVPIPLQLKFAKGVPDKPGRMPYPRNDEMTCPHCKRSINLKGSRQQIEAQLSRKILIDD